jgi:hypothetical protein
VRAGLTGLLPTLEDTLLLRACLWTGSEAGAAWDEYVSVTPTPAHLFHAASGRLRRLSPMLLESLRRNGIDADPGLLTVLRTSLMRESMRCAIYRDIRGDVLRALGDAGIDTLVVKGGALGETVYGDQTLRHSHDIDLLVRPVDLQGARDALGGLGLHGPTGSGTAAGPGIEMVHDSGLPVLLHTRRWRIEPYESDPEGPWRRSREVVLGNVAARVMSPEDHLVHQLGHASYCPSRSSLLWAVDGYLIADRNEDLDVDRVRSEARGASLSTPLSVMIEYLRVELEAAFPAALVDGLAEDAERAGGLERDLALRGARVRMGPDVHRALRSISGWPGRLRVGTRMLFPSPAYMRWAHGVSNPLLLPLHYAWRPLRVLRGLLRR